MVAISVGVARRGLKQALAGPQVSEVLGALRVSVVRKRRVERIATTRTAIERALGAGTWGSCAMALISAQRRRGRSAQAFEQRLQMAALDAFGRVAVGSGGRPRRQVKHLA